MTAAAIFDFFKPITASWNNNWLLSYYQIWCTGATQKWPIY